MQTAAVQPQNPFQGPHAKPDWAQLTRLAGDRATILFEDLRRRVSKITGLQEELHYYGPGWGWAPRYHVGERTLLTVHVLPGRLEATVALEGPLRERLLTSPRVAAGIKEAIRHASIDNGTVHVRVRLSSRSDIRSLASLVLMKSKLLATRDNSSTTKTPRHQENRSPKS